jgi:Fic family protein
MTRGTVERAPVYDPETADHMAIFKHFKSHGIVDSQGRYLHWSELKWRLHPKSEAHNIWFAIKIQRGANKNSIGLKSPNEEEFSYCVPPSVEVKLHQILIKAGGSTPFFGGEKTSKHLSNQFLVASLIAEEAISSAQLEGAAVTREVAKKMLETDQEPKTEDERMVLNNYILLKKAEQCSQAPLSLELILEFHKIATSGTTENNVVPGCLRESDDVYVADKSGEIAYQPPSHELLHARLEQLCRFANKDHSGVEGNQFIPPVIKAIILHFMLGYEHPFRDGNGRTARALFYWYMLKHGYTLLKYISISKLLKEEPKKYGLAYMYTETDQNDLTYFIDYQVDIIVRAIKELEANLEAKAREFNESLLKLENYAQAQELNFQQKDIIKKALKTPGRVFAVSEISKDYDVSDNSARKYLKHLADSKLLLTTKSGRETLYIAPADLPVRLNNR